MAANQETMENIKFAQTAFAQFNLFIQQGNDGNPVYVIRHNDNRVIAALSQRLTPEFNTTAHLPNREPIIILTNDDIQKMRIAIDRGNRINFEMGIPVPPFQYKIADLMGASQQPANPQPPQSILYVAAGSTSTHFNPQEVKHIFQKLNANPDLKQQFLTGGGKSYEDTLALQSRPDKSLYMLQQSTNLSLAIRLLYQINAVVTTAGNSGYNVIVNTPEKQQTLQRIKQEAIKQSQNSNAFLPAPQASSSAAAPQASSSTAAPQAQSPAAAPQAQSPAAAPQAPGIISRIFSLRK